MPTGYKVVELCSDGKLHSGIVTHEAGDVIYEEGYGLNQILNAAFLLCLVIMD